tara:strand:- start:260 stop:394 length:135 start_codon:yes stop_codon:yes gene_type:complete
MKKRKIKDGEGLEEVVGELTGSMWVGISFLGIMIGEKEGRQESD